MLRVALPLDEERQLRILRYVVDADLPPQQIEAVRTTPMPVRGGAAEPVPGRPDVLDSHCPGEPPATGGRTSLYCASERCTVDRGMVQRRDDLQVAPLG